MNTKLTLAALALVIGSAFSSASFAQSGTITFTGSIVAPACTGTGVASTNEAAFSVSLGQCANSDAQVVRTSVFSAKADINTDTNTEQNNTSAVVTVTYE